MKRDVAVLIIAQDFRDIGPGFDSGISRNDPGELQDHCVCKDVNWQPPHCKGRCALPGLKVSMKTFEDRPLRPGIESLLQKSLGCGSVADPYYFDTDPDPGCERKFVTDPDPGWTLIQIRIQATTIRIRIQQKRTKYLENL